MTAKRSECRGNPWGRLYGDILDHGGKPTDEFAEYINTMRREWDKRHAPIIDESDSAPCEKMRCEALGDGECYKGHELGFCDACSEERTPSKEEMIAGDCMEVMKQLPPGIVNTCITSPPYWGLRDYGIEGQYGLEETPEEYVGKMVEVFREVKRVLRDDGTLWLNLGDSYASNTKGDTRTKEQLIAQGATCGNTVNAVASLGGIRKMDHGLKEKDLCGIPWRVALALQADGWYLRCDIIWSKPNPMPESVRDRPTKAHEYIFLMSKNQRYYYDADAIKEELITAPHKPGWSSNVSERNDRQVDNESNQREWGTESGRNKRSVWTVPTQPFPDAHFAVFPPKLIEPCVLAGCPEGGIVLDPFCGSGTTCYVAKEMKRNYIGIDLNPKYLEMAAKRTAQGVL